MIVNGDAECEEADEIGPQVPQIVPDTREFHDIQSVFSLLDLSRRSPASEAWTKPDAAHPGMVHFQPFGQVAHGKPLLLALIAQPFQQGAVLRSIDRLFHAPQCSPAVRCRKIVDATCG